MFVAILALILTTNLFISQSKLSYNNKKKVFLFFSGILLFVFHCFKDHSNFYDLPEYVAAFDYLVYGEVEDATFLLKSEPGWLYFNKFITHISNNHLFLFVVHSAVVISAYMITINKFSHIPWLSVFLFITGPFNQSMYVMRQHFAIAICLYSLQYILNRDFWKFLFVVLLATSFHYTALFFFPAFYLYGLKFDRKFWIILLMILFILLVFFQIGVNYLMTDLDIGYNSYAEKEGTNYTAFLISTCIFILLIFSVDFKNLEYVDKLITQLFLFGYIVSFAGVGVSITSRLNMFYTVMNILVIPLAVKKFKYPIRCFVLLPILFLYFYMWVSKDLEGYRFLFSTW